VQLNIFLFETGYINQRHYCPGSPVTLRIQEQNVLIPKLKLWHKLSYKCAELTIKE